MYYTPYSLSLTLSAYVLFTQFLSMRQIYINIYGETVRSGEETQIGSGYRKKYINWKSLCIYFLVTKVFHSNLFKFLTKVLLEKCNNIRQHKQPYQISTWEKKISKVPHDIITKWHRSKTFRLPAILWNCRQQIT